MAENSEGTSGEQVIDAEGLAVFARIAHKRRSVRAYLPEPVRDDALNMILEATLATPSNCNAQPWFINIVRGRVLQDWSKALIQAASTGAPGEQDITPAGPYPGVYRERQIDAAVRLFDAQGIGRDDKMGRMRSLLRNFEFFGAPQVALFCVPDWAGVREIADCGAAMQSFMLACTAAGLGSCPQGALGAFTEVTRNVLNIPTDQLIFAGISFGFEDIVHETAAVRPPRCSAEQVVRMIGDG